MLVSFPKTGRTWLRMVMGRALVERFSLPERLVLDTYQITRTLPHGPQKDLP